MAKKKQSTASGAPDLKLFKAPPTSVYQLKITLDHVKPPIWRRVLTRDCTLAQLHDVIQSAMGWCDGHLHLFEIGGEQFGLPQQWDGDDEINDSRKIKVSDLASEGLKKFHYMYDMGDSWRHTILIEKTVEAESDAQFPRCVGGKRACPPEDCGGPWGYGNLLEAISDPKHPEHDEMVNWVGEEFDPEAFEPDR